MSDWLYAFFSLDYSGLILALIGAAISGLLLSRADHSLARIASFAVLGVSILAMVGGLSHLYRVWSVTSDLPAPGTFVEVDGTRMHIIAEGPKSAPTLVWFGGGHSAGLTMHQFHTALKEDVRSVLIDRPGTGWSDTGPFPRTTAREAEEMMAALEAHGESGPYVFIGHSFGGLLAANMARRNPDETAALVLLDPTPPDIVVYGLDKAGLSSLETLERRNGLKRVFGLYRHTPPPLPPFLAKPVANAPAPMFENPFETAFLLSIRSGQSLAGASIYEELRDTGFAQRGFETVVFDGELGDLPLYLVAPKGPGDPMTEPYVNMVAKDAKQAERFKKFLNATRENYLRASSNSKRVVAPTGTGHNFLYEEPEFLITAIKDILAELPSRPAISQSEWQVLTDWSGPYGGVPPVEKTEPDALKAAYLRALDEKRAEIGRIAANPEEPTFNNTVLAFETSGQALARLDALLAIFAQTVDDPRYKKVAGDVASLKAALDDEIYLNAALFQRISGVAGTVGKGVLNPMEERLTDVWLQIFKAKGAQLDDGAKAALREVNTEIATLVTKFNQNSIAAERAGTVFVSSQEALDGLTQQQIRRAKDTAKEMDKPDAWAIPASYPTVMPVMSYVHDRGTRKAVWQAWTLRAGQDGPHDNRPVTNAIVQLRAKKAQLFGYDSFADYQTAHRMVGRPQVPKKLMMDSWRLLKEEALEEGKALRKIAAARGFGGPLEPWDYLYYRNLLREETINLDMRDLQPFFEMDNVIASMFAVAKTAYGISFSERDDIPVAHPSIRTFEATKGGDVLGLLYADLYQRAGKSPSSWATSYRMASTHGGKVLPLVALHSAAPVPAEGKPALLTFERANVIFHEFGHTLQTLANAAPYDSLSPYALPWDFIEVPSLFHEQWFRDRSLIQTHMRHHETGEPMSDTMLDKLAKADQFNRIFSVSLDFLSGAIFDLELYGHPEAAEGIDVAAFEDDVLQDLELPAWRSPLMRSYHFFHLMSDAYAAGVYTYYWSDALAADIGEVFHASREGLYDAGLNEKYYDLILSAGAMLPAEEAFRRFRGRDPDPAALLRRFNIEAQ